MMSSMKKIDRPDAVDGPVGSEGGRSPSMLSTGQALPAPAAPTATPTLRIGPLAPGQRWSVARKREQKKRWFRNGQKWRTGCEGRISVAKRRHGLDRCRYKGSAGMKRWVGLGVVADNLISIGRVMEEQSLQR